ncbi:MAG: GrpB family protein [Clostridium sp.]|nr:GrpB family protein [Clostridium sp.]
MKDIFLKELSEMTLEELWELFPIIIKEHNPEYKLWYKEEKMNLLSEFSDIILRINHIGSTSVKGLKAKPTVDILMEISQNSDISDVKDKLSAMGWILISSSEEEFRQVYNKGYTKYGFAEKVYHLHVRYKNNWNELYFRDYLIDHPEVAKEYEKLKLKLWKEFEHNRDAYTDAKSEFILSYTKKAKEEYGDKYL